MTFQGSINIGKGKPKSSNSDLVSQNSKVKVPIIKIGKKTDCQETMDKHHSQQKNAKTLTLSERKKQPESESEHPR